FKAFVSRRGIATPPLRSATQMELTASLATPPDSAPSYAMASPRGDQSGANCLKGCDASLTGAEPSSLRRKICEYGERDVLTAKYPTSSLVGDQQGMPSPNPGVVLIARAPATA